LTHNYPVKKMQKRTGGEILIDALRINGVDTIFGVPGESYLFALDAIVDQGDAMRFITCRQEGGAAYASAAWASATGKPGICFVTRGPGVTNASVGVHTAYQDSTPMLLLIGQIPRGEMEREAFQEIDYRRMLGPLTKWVAQVDDTARLPEFVNRAMRIASTGRPGPVALALPEDMLKEVAEVADLPAAVTTITQPDGPSIHALEELLRGAQRPLVVLGGSRWSAVGRDALHQFIERNQLPVCTGFRRQSLFDNRHDCYAGNLNGAAFPYLQEYAADADLIIAIGSRLADMTTGRYRLVNAPSPKQKLAHILAAPEELGRVLTPDLAICADLDAFSIAASQAIYIKQPAWATQTGALSRSYRAALNLGPQVGPVDMGQVMAYLRQKLPGDAIVTNGAGNYADWPNKFYTYRNARTILAPISGSMGYSMPSLVAAKVAFPERIAVGFAGDGDFLMNGQELATAVQYGLNPIMLVINNSSYGTIRMHQERNFPGRVSGTDLHNPDFAAFARSFGANGEVIASTDDFAPAFERALTSDRATVLEIQVGPESFGPDVSLAGIKQATG